VKRAHHTSKVDGKSEEEMTKAEMIAFRKPLLSLKKRIAGDLSELEEQTLRPGGGESAGNLSDLPTHPADLATETMDEEIAMTLVQNEDQLLTEINNALAHIDAGTFGSCENCHQPVSKERLQALPYARYCIRCAREIEERGRS
jgi:DnaK suppressor protein